MGVITVSGIKLYAFHGCMEEESKIGSNYEVDVVLESDLSMAAKHDELIKDFVGFDKIIEKYL